ncbi:MAG: hypothetical protein NPINA01_22850 [Nitrospinaceae bacterium]|nr:MAG: hypothetical protein NPINA01_22850 [Nitrospinaceae bacterium]
MEDSRPENDSAGNTERFILKFVAATGFTVVLEYSGLERLQENQEKIEAAGLQCERLAEFNLNFDQADLFMDMRSPECIAQFDLEDWI